MKWLEIPDKTISTKTITNQQTRQNKKQSKKKIFIFKSKTIVFIFFFRIPAMWMSEIKKNLNHWKMEIKFCYTTTTTMMNNAQNENNFPFRVHFVRFPAIYLCVCIMKCSTIVYFFENIFISFFFLHFFKHQPK